VDERFRGVAVVVVCPLGVEETIVETVRSLIEAGTVRI